MSDQRREQIELLREEIADIDTQVLYGDLDPDTAAGIKERYEADLAELEAASPVVAPSDQDDSGSEFVREGKRLSGRALLGVAIVAVACAVVAVFAVQSLSGGGSSGVEGVAGDVLEGQGEVDLDSISNEQMEQVVAENPDIVPMRLALARRYFEGGEFDKALEHYFVVLDLEQHPEALANVGWMTYLSGRPDVAVGYLEAALDREPNYMTAQWFIGNVYFSLERFEDAVGPLTIVVSAEDIPAEVKETARELLAQIEAQV